MSKKKQLAEILKECNARIVPKEEMSEEWQRGYEDGFNAGRYFADIMPTSEGYVSFEWSDMEGVWK